MNILEYDSPGTTQGKNVWRAVSGEEINETVVLQPPFVMLNAKL